MSNIHDIKNGLTALSDAIEALQSQPSPKPEILDRGLSGNKINGGMITNFKSVGIVDEAKEVALTVHNDGITVTNINVKNVNNDLKVNGALTVNGEITATKLHVDELSADVRNERTSPLEFKAEEGKLGGKGLLWVGDGHTKQFVFKSDTDRLWSSEDIDIRSEKVYRIDGTSVLALNVLGPSVTKSSLREVGSLNKLTVNGPVNIDAFIFYDADSQRLGLGTESPNGSFSVKSLDHEFIIDDTEDKQFKIGTWTTTGLHIVTDDQVRLSVAPNGNINLKNKVTVDGSLGVNVNNFSSDADITTAGPVRFQNKKFEVGNNVPSSGNYVVGDIVWNDNPQPTGYVGWICVRDGSPGTWKAFGQIEN